MGFEDDTIWRPEVPEREVVHDFPLGDDRGYELAGGQAHWVGYHEGLLDDFDLTDWHEEMKAARARRRPAGFTSVWPDDPDLTSSA